MEETIDDNECEHKKCINHTKSEIQEFIDKCIKLINQEKKDYLPNEKNFAFQTQYGIEDVWKIAVLISVNYFCYSADDYRIIKNQKRKDRVYIFKIPHYTGNSHIYIYLKLKIRSKSTGEDVFVLSLHEPEKPLKVLWID